MGRGSPTSDTGFPVCLTGPSLNSQHPRQGCCLTEASVGGRLLRTAVLRGQLPDPSGPWLCFLLPAAGDLGPRRSSSSGPLITSKELSRDVGLNQCPPPDPLTPWGPGTPTPYTSCHKSFTQRLKSGPASPLTVGLRLAFSVPHLYPGCRSQTGRAYGRVVRGRRSLLWVNLRGRCICCPRGPGLVTFL